MRIKDPFPLRAWKRAFFVPFIDLSALKIEASAKQSTKKSINQTKNNLSTLVVETALKTYLCRDISKFKINVMLKKVL